MLHCGVLLLLLEQNTARQLNSWNTQTDTQQKKKDQIILPSKRCRIITFLPTRYFRRIITYDTYLPRVLLPLGLLVAIIKPLFIKNISLYFTVWLTIVSKKTRIYTKYCITKRLRWFVAVTPPPPSPFFRGSVATWPTVGPSTVRNHHTR